MSDSDSDSIDIMVWIYGLDHTRRHFEPSAHGLCVSLIVSLHINILGKA